MCGTCGCGHDDNILFRKPGAKPVFNHHINSGREIQVKTDVLQFNNLTAERNRGYFEALKITAYNLVSSPGAGKTTILEKTIQKLKNKIPFFVIEGDQQTMLDAERIQVLGVPVIQINTGSGCHLDAAMISKTFDQLDLTISSTLFIENVGNLVCPSMFDLGESFRVAIISTTEGDDKPLKYPDIFASSNVCLINKIDLLPYLDSNIAIIKQNALKINPNLIFFEVSAKTEEGFDEWLNWIISNQQTI